MDVPGRITTVEELESHYRAPNERVRSKELSGLTDVMAAFVDHVTFAVLATSDGRGSVDASPRGGPPGFVRRLDDRHLAIPDLTGNNRLDSYRNILQHPYAGLLLVVPGYDETLRVNGPAAISTDPALLSGFTTELRTPKVALLVETAEVYGHCAKAFRRGQVWAPDSWATDGVPDLPAMYACLWNGDEGALRTTLGQSYASDLASDRRDAS